MGDVDPAKGDRVRVASGAVSSAVLGSFCGSVAYADNDQGIYLVRGATRMFRVEGRENLTVQ